MFNKLFFVFQNIVILYSAKSEVLQDSAKKSCRNYLIEKTIRGDKVNSISRTSKDDIRKCKFDAGSSLNKIQSTEALRKIPIEKYINPHRLKIIQKASKQSNSFGEKDVSKDSGYFFRRHVNKQIKGIKSLGIKDKNKSNVTSKKSIEEEEHNICISSVKTLVNEEVSADLMTETNNQKADEYIANNNGELSDGSDGKGVSDICCGSIFCDCKICSKVFREALQTTKVKPNTNHKYN